MQDKDASRNDRLKAALRENLKRRKAQARARRDAPSSGREPAHGEPERRPGDDEAQTG